MATQKNNKSKKSNKQFRKTNSRRQRGGYDSDSEVSDDEYFIHIINSYSSLLTTPIVSDMIKKMERLLNKGVDINIKGNFGNTSLINASKFGFTRIVKFLLDKNANMNMENAQGNTAIVLASENGNIGIVKMLLDKGADVNSGAKRTALIWASHLGYINIVKLLLENGADVYVEDAHGNALYWATRMKETRILKLLKEAIENEKKIRDHKQEAMKHMEDRDVKIPSLRTLIHRQLPTHPTTEINEYDFMLPPSKLGGKRKSKRKTNKRFRKTRSKRGGDMENQNDDTFIVTIAIITHGCIIDTDSTQNQYDIRYYSATGDKINTCDGTVFGRSIHHDDLIEYFRHDNPSSNNNNSTINEIPYYFDDMPYDKVIGKTENQGFIDDCLDAIAPIFTGTTVIGVWVISVHKEKIIEKNKQLVKKYEYIYPTDKNRHINLFNIEGLKELNQIIGKNKFNIRSELVENNKPLPKKENNIRNFQHWDVELNNTKERINYIRLSYLFDLIKKIAGNNCKLNVYDYTCSVNCNVCNNININNNQEIKQGLVTGIEEGKMPFFTGGKRKTRKNRRRRKKAGTNTPNSSFDEGHTDKESISVDPDEPFYTDIEAIPIANEVHQLEMELLDDSFASFDSIGPNESVELDDITPDLDESLSLGGKRKTIKTKQKGGVKEYSKKYIAEQRKILKPYKHIDPFKSTYINKTVDLVLPPNSLSSYSLPAPLYDTIVGPTKVPKITTDIFNKRKTRKTKHK